MTFTWARLNNPSKVFLQMTGRRRQTFYIITLSDTLIMSRDNFRWQFILLRQLRSCYKKTNGNQWLKYANDAPTEYIVNDTKKTLYMLRLYVPLSIFLSLFDQQVNIISFPRRYTTPRVNFENYSFRIRLGYFKRHARTTVCSVWSFRFAICRW